MSYDSKETLKEPYAYLLQIPGKAIRSKLIEVRRLRCGFFARTATDDVFVTTRSRSPLDTHAATGIRLVVQDPRGREDRGQGYCADVTHGVVAFG